MKYFAQVKDNAITGKTTCPCNNSDLQYIEISQDIFDNLDKYVCSEGVLMLDPDYETKQAAKEEERINKLTMTSLDLINLIKSQGVDDTTIYEFLQKNISLNMQLTYCQNVYCGVVRQLLPLKVGDVEITDELIIYAFRKKNGEDVELPTPQ